MTISIQKDTSRIPEIDVEPAIVSSNCDSAPLSLMEELYSVISTIGDIQIAIEVDENSSRFIERF